MAVVLTLVVVMATSVAALAAVDKFAADFEQDTLAGVYRTRVEADVNYYALGYRARMNVINKRSGNYAIVYVNSHLHSESGMFTGAGVKDFAGTKSNPRFSAWLSADGDAGAFGYIGIKAVVS